MKRKAASFVRFLLSHASGKPSLPALEVFSSSYSSNEKRQLFEWIIQHIPFFARLWQNHKKWITVELLGKFITGISIIYKWYSFPLFSIKRLSHRNAPYKLFANRILKLRHPKHLFLMYCNKSPILHYFYRPQVRSFPCLGTKSLIPCSCWFWFQIRFVKIDF